MQVDKRGFTLLEILLVLGIVGIITAFAVTISSSVKGMAKVIETKNRMQKIADATVDYYSSHQVLPELPTAAENDSVPVGASYLNLEQKYRYDPWGQLFRYDVNEKTNIKDVTVDGVEVAGAIVSGGPDQVLAGTNQDYSTYSTTNDDIVMPINVHNEGVLITLEELKVLQDKVNAFDKQFEGVDNNGNDSVDESGCVADDDISKCPPIISDESFNDPNCGRATLSRMNGSPVNYYNCTWATNSPKNHIRGLFFLPAVYGCDSWNQEYLWDNDSQRFYSAGPDGYDSTPAEKIDNIYP